jgi:predicted small integral membrane protein
MWQMRKADAESFNRAKVPALVGCAISMIMLFGGFIVAAEVYFELWKTELGRAALPQAFRYFASIALLAIFVQQPDTQ